MSKVRIVLNSAGIRELLQSPGVRADLQRRARAIATTAGAGGGEFEVDSSTGRNRARVSVSTADFDARRAEAVDRTLTRAIDAGRA